MPFIDLEPQPLGALLETPKGAFVTPGSDDVELGSDAPAAPGWSDTFKAGWRQDNTIASQLTRADLSAPTVDDTGNEQYSDAPDQTYTAAGGATNNTIVKALICYDSDTTAGTDANLVPLVACGFSANPTTDGNDLVLRIAANGFFGAT